MPLAGFTGKVSLAASGLPAGLSVSFGSPSASGASTLTISAPLSAGPGTSTVKITGTSGNLTASTAIGVSVVAPANYAISITPSLSISQGASGSATVRAVGTNGFNGAVAFSVQGLPSGVTAIVAPSGTQGVSIVTLSVAKTALKGATTVTIAGTSGTLSHTAPLTLTITAPAS
jgi:hypothetical protein